MKKQEMAEREQKDLKHGEWKEINFKLLQLWL